MKPNVEVTVNGEPAEFRDDTVFWKRAVGTLCYNTKTDGGKWFNSKVWVVDGKTITFTQPEQSERFKFEESFNLDKALKEMNDILSSFTSEDFDEWFPEEPPPKNEGFHIERTLINDPVGRLEKALSDLWKEENVPTKNVNYGKGILQDLCCSVKKGHGVEFYDLDEHSRTVAATVVQWLGTNIGRCFLENAYRDAGWEIQIRSDRDKKIY
jgi:hypothetical protein